MRPQMQAASLDVVGRRLMYAVSDNTRDKTWALNIHGWFAGGGMYWRESSRLASALGWRVINPSLPGFGGSEPLLNAHSQMEGMADHLAVLLTRLGVEKVIVLGHSMGGVIAVDLASRYPDLVSGIIYRDGAATPAWKRLTWGRALLPAESIDLCIGRVRSTVRSLYPDFRTNARSPRSTLPAALELMGTDMRQQIHALSERGLPMLCVWGRYDQITPPAAAREFCQEAGSEPVWVHGSHSWMLARPHVQARVLTHTPLGRAFTVAVQ